MRPRVGTRVTEFVDESPGGTFRSKARLIYDEIEGHIYIEIESSHDDTTVCNAIRTSRANFSAKVRNMGVL